MTDDTDNEPYRLAGATEATSKRRHGPASAKSLPCPYCQQPLVAGSAICVYCGSDLSALWESVAANEAAEREQIRTAAPPPRAEPTPVAQRAEAAQNRQSKTFLLVAGIAVVSLVVDSAATGAFIRPA